MKKKLFAVLVALSMCFSMFGIVNVHAKETLEEYHYTNPIYKDLKFSDTHNNIQTYSLNNIEYTSDKEKLAQTFREKLTNRESNINLYYRCDEEITQDFFNNLVQQLFQKAISHTEIGKEGDYLKWNCERWVASAAIAPDANGGYDIDIFYNVYYLTTLEQEQKVDEAISNLLKSLDLTNKTDYQRIKTIYDYICSNVTYDYNNLNDESYSLKYTAYAALISKTAVCQGYASLFYRLALEAGVDSRIISGTAGESHGWNIVKLHGKYYNLDSTWDAGKDIYNYFLKNMNDFSDHVRDAEYQADDFVRDYPVWEDSYQESENQYLDYEYKINDEDQVIITKYTGSDENVITPTIIDNKPVVGIGHYTFIDNQNLKTITVSEGIEFLEGILAGSCSNLKQINLPSTLNMGDYEENVFSGCNGLVDHCMQLEKITVSQNNPYLCVDDEILYTKNKSAVIASATKHNFGDLVLPSTVTYINGDAFSQNETLTSIQIPDSVTFIGYWAFDHCHNLRQINIPQSIKFIGQYAFHETSIEELFIPKEVGNVGICGDRFTNFYKSEPIQKITVEEGNPYYKVVDGALIYDDCLLIYEGGNKQKSYTMPNYITKIAWYAFDRAENLEKITLSNKLEEISIGSFQDCINLKQIHIPEGIKRIDDYSFWGCKNLKKVYFPKSLTEINNNVFANVWSITDVYFAGSKEQWEQLPKGNTFDKITPTYHYNYKYVDCDENGHNYAQPIYTWSSDNKTVTAKKVCLNNDLHIEEETVITKQTTKNADCLQDGCITYTANFENSAFEEQTKTEVIPALGHEEIIDQSKEATCIEDGLTEGSHCSRCNEIIKRQEIIPALGHNYINGVCTRCHTSKSGQWKQLESKWWYQYEDGTYPKDEFIKIDNKLYRFDSLGYMQAGWFKINNEDYYASGSGEIKAQWVASGNNWYYVDETGKMVTGDQIIDGKKYYFAKNGLMQSGWFKINNEDYYASGSGEIKAQWIAWGNSWYYVDKTGKTVAGDQTIDGKKYYFAKNGLMQTGWFKINNEDYYASRSGEIKAQWVASGNNWYYVDETGKMVTGDYVIDGKVNHFDANGVWKK